MRSHTPGCARAGTRGQGPRRDQTGTGAAGPPSSPQCVLKALQSPQLLPDAERPALFDRDARARAGLEPQAQVTGGHVLLQFLPRRHVCVFLVWRIPSEQHRVPSGNAWSEVGCRNGMFRAWGRGGGVHQVPRKLKSKQTAF